MIYRFAITVLLAVLTAGCTITEVFDGDGVRLTKHWSFGVVAFPAVGDSYLVQMQGIGIAATAHFDAIGYYNIETTSIGHDCFALFVLHDATEARRIMERHFADGICTTQGERP